MIFKFIIKIFGRIIGLYARIRDYLYKQYYRANGIEIGKSTYLSPKAYIDLHKPGKINIGENCYITRNVVILCHTDTHKGGPLGIWEKDGEGREFGSVTIGDNVFIGVNSVVMPGVSIGNNVIIGALTLVNMDIPNGKIVAGVPAKIVGLTENHIKDFL